MDNDNNIKIAGTDVLNRTLMRRRQAGVLDTGIDLSMVLTEIVQWADRFVPSEAGSILLDDPILKRGGENKGRLYFAACFGQRAQELAGTSISDGEGIAGHTYKYGEPYISEDVSSDEAFLKRIDSETQYKTKSIICAPIMINNSIIGTIELLNRKDRENYDRNDLLLLEIFAGYTGQLIEKSLAAREFENLSKQDNLTGLHNDRYFLKQIKTETTRARKKGDDVSLLFMDLDRFKEINDTHGHLVGSRVLAEVGAIMKDLFPHQGDTLVRYGGDEYAVILPGRSLDEAVKEAEKLRLAIEEFVFINEPGTNKEPPLNIKGVITSSIGVASFVENVELGRSIDIMAEALLSAADKAMYKSKDSGKNCVSTLDILM